MEKIKLFSPYKSGFRCGMGTLDSIVRLELDIRKALTNEEAVAVFFDIEKDYDMLWKEGLLIQLEQIGIGYIIGLNNRKKYKSEERRVYIRKRFD